RRQACTCRAHMHECSRTRIHEWCVAMVTALAMLPAAWADDDPYRTQARIPPNHHSAWTGGEALDVPLPLLEVAPDVSAALTLAQLTDLALRNNPRTRQAWAAARVEAAQYGIA